MGRPHCLLRLRYARARLELALVDRHNFPISKIHHRLFTLGNVPQRSEKIEGHGSHKILALFIGCIRRDRLRFRVPIAQPRLFISVHGCDLESRVDGDHHGLVDRYATQIVDLDVGGGTVPRLQRLSN